MQIVVIFIISLVVIGLVSWFFTMYNGLIHVKENIKKSKRYGSIHFTYNGILTKEQAFKVQQDYGRHPHGYGFYSHKVENGVTTWNCQNSCD